MQHLLGLVIVMNSNAVQHYYICHLCVFYGMVFYFFFFLVFFFIFIFLLGSGSSSILTGFTMHSSVQPFPQNTWEGQRCRITELMP